MKKLLFLLLIPFLCSMAEQDDAKFIGRWTSSGTSNVASVEFLSDGYASFVINGQEKGGKNTNNGGRQTSLVYEINRNADPIEVDFILTDIETGIQKRMLCIARFIDDDTMEMVFNFQNNRPKKFKKKETAVFVRD